MANILAGSPNQHRAEPSSATTSEAGTLTICKFSKTDGLSPQATSVKPASPKAELRASRADSQSGHVSDVKRYMPEARPVFAILAGARERRLSTAHAIRRATVTTAVMTSARIVTSLIEYRDATSEGESAFTGSSPTDD